MTNLAPHDLEALIDQAVVKESLASELRNPRDPSWKEHLVDAAEAYNRVGLAEQVERCLSQLPAELAETHRARLAPAPAAAEAEEQVAGKPDDASGDSQQPSTKPSQPPARQRTSRRDAR
jgi:hypothetical protein